jgi:hypothetical protein
MLGVRIVDYKPPRNNEEKRNKRVSRMRAAAVAQATILTLKELT